MMKRSLTRLAVAGAGLALSLTAGAGFASADPDPLIDTTCSYPQVVSAMTAENPGAAAQFNSSPPVQSFLRKFLASPPDQRARMAQQVERMPGADMGAIRQVFNVCNNY